MQRIAGIGAVIVTLALFGCATTSQKGTMDHLTKDRQQMDEVRGQIDRTMYSLDSLLRAPPAEIRAAQNGYASNVNTLHKNAQQLDQAAQDLRARKINYLTEWERAQLSIQSPELKRAGDQRRKQVVQSLNNLETAMNNVNDGLGPLLASLDDVQHVTDNDPTPAGISAVKNSGIVKVAQKRAANANSRLDVAASRFDRTLASLMPQAGTQPVQAAKAPAASKSAAATAALPTFSRADRNASSAIEQDEASQLPGLDFQAADRDRDGKLSESEYEAASKSRSTIGGSDASQGGTTPAQR